MERIKPRTLSGFMELLPAQQQQMERVMDILRTTYSRYGFTPLDTPIIEASEILLAKGGGETEKQIYRFSKGDSDLSLRFDLTVPLAKYVALHYNELAFPFRRFQIGKVYRGERAQRGRFREFYQADIDVIGDGELDIMNDAEIPAIIYDVFSAMGLKRFQIRINNRRVLNGFYSMLGLTEQSGEKVLMSSRNRTQLTLAIRRLCPVLVQLRIAKVNCVLLRELISTFSPLCSVRPSME